MNWRDYILAALGEQVDRWEESLASLRAEQIAAPYLDHDWSTKDVIVHLWAKDIPSPSSS
jgi:hypothetical protein